jgi:hypothetical protein
MQEPGVSWAKQGKTPRTLSIAHQPWKLIPAIFVVVTVRCLTLGTAARRVILLFMKWTANYDGGKS